MPDWICNYTAVRVLYHLNRLRGARRRRDPEAAEAERRRAAFYEAVWREAAEAAGADFVRLGYGIFEIRQGDFLARVAECCTPLDDPVALTVAGNKPLVYRLLAAEGLPVPRHAVFTLREISRAAAFLDSAGVPCVVKPASGTGAGRGVTTGVRRRSQLAWAAVGAAAHGAELLIEEQRAGDNYRLLYLDGELLDAVVRRPPTVVGDGKSTIRGLVRAANAARLAHRPARVVNLLSIDLDMRNTLAGLGLSLRSVPEAGRVLALKTVINQNFGPENASANGMLCDAVVEAGAAAARCVGARLAGVDVVTPDPTLPLGRAGGVVLEVNTTPGFHHHYHKPDGDYPVAARVLGRLMEGQAGRRVADACRA